ncbi:arginase family protein [Duganella caerulea]|uniref:arginase family protein n=1 Tax=Duganella caerulea TaxID=2885762 RepID=UPI0040381F31
MTASSRCAASLATLPVVARHRPDACVVWFDAHADLNTPSTTDSGYLGGMVAGAVDRRPGPGAGGAPIGVTACRPWRHNVARRCPDRTGPPSPRRTPGR